MKRILLSLFITSSVLAAHADEGMWMLTDLQKQNEVAMTELGLLIPANQIYNPDGIALKDAVVHFGGGCTGEVISAEGLVLTNHHCGYGAIQQHSSVEHDYLTDGFWAMSREEELLQGTHRHLHRPDTGRDRLRKRTTENRRRPERHQLSVSQIPKNSSRPLRQVRRHRPDTRPQTGTESFLRWKQILSIRKNHL